MLYRVQAEVSDIDAGLYWSLPVRVARHSSEDAPRLVARVLAYCLVYQEGLAFGPGLDEAKEPALSLRDATGAMVHWVDIGYPSAERLHRASKATERVTVFCHKPPEGLLRERAKRAIYKAEQIRVWLLAPDMVQAAGEVLARNSQWTVTLTGQDLMLTVDDHVLSSAVSRTTLAEL